MDLLVGGLLHLGDLPLHHADLVLPRRDGVEQGLVHPLCPPDGILGVHLEHLNLVPLIPHHVQVSLCLHGPELHCQSLIVGCYLVQVGRGRGMLVPQSVELAVVFIREPDQLLELALVVDSDVLQIVLQLLGEVGQSVDFELGLHVVCNSVVV